jgi:hypothetical protein
MDQVDKVHAWKQTRTGLIVTGLVELLFAYIFGSKAIDSGSYWHYLLAAILIVGAVISFAKAHKLYVGKK